MSAPESEILSFIARNKVDGIRTTFSSLLNTFEKKPNGWSYASILCMVARLYGLAKIEVSLDNKLLDESSFERAIRNTTYHSRIIVQPVLEICATKIKRMKTVYADAFHKPVSTNEAKSLATEFSKAVDQKYIELQRYMERIDRFPFLEQLNPAVDLLRRLQNKTYDWYYSNLDEFEVELPDTIEHVVDPILSFMNGSQKSIYEDARKFLIDQQYNLPYVGGDEIEKLKDILGDKNCFRGNHMITAKELVGILSDKVERKLTELRQQKEQQLESYKRKLENIEGYAQLSQDRIDSVERELTSIQKQIQSITQISMINDRFSRFESYDFLELASKIKNWGEVEETPPQLQDSKDVQTESETPPLHTPPVFKKKSITISTLKPRYSKTFLESQTDVEEYVQAFKAALLAELEKGNSLLVN
jgi:DNA-directed RNA polymerase subunit F